MQVFSQLVNLRLWHCLEHVQGGQVVKHQQGSATMPGMGTVCGSHTWVFVHLEVSWFFAWDHWGYLARPGSPVPSGKPLLVLFCGAPTTGSSEGRAAARSCPCSALAAQRKRWQTSGPRCVSVCLTSPPAFCMLLPGWWCWAAQGWQRGPESAAAEWHPAVSVPWTGGVSGGYVVQLRVTIWLVAARFACLVCHPYH